MRLHDDGRLLSAAIQYLETQLMPTLDEEHRFRTRLTVNALKMVERSLRTGAPQPLSAEPLSALDDATLADRIRDGQVPLDDPALLAELEGRLAARLSIHNPKWMA